MKRLVCFFDGTWDTADDKEVTNVVKLQRAILKTDGIHQLTHYEIGIASEYTGRLSFWAGVLSVGLGSRVQGGYRFLCEHYEAGDEIYLFGFSRGAFEARILVDLISFVGLIRRDANNRPEQAWSYYRRYRANPQHKKFHRLHENAHFPVRIKCVGVWDTVGTLGIPSVQRLSGSQIRPFPAIVDLGLQALAIDEPRGPYSPILWTTKRDAVIPQRQTVEQVWFPGSHDDVGGGGNSHALSDAALLWMAGRVTDTTDLAIDFAYLRATTAADPEGEQCWPTTGLYRVSGLVPYVRLIKQNLSALLPLRRFVFRGWRTNQLPRDELPVNEIVHESAIVRFGKIVPVRSGEEVRKQRYCPRSLKAIVHTRGKNSG